jgi:hypothetical protein
MLGLVWGDTHLPRDTSLTRNKESRIRSRIHDCTISLRFLGIILKVLLREVSV